jgi:PAS domain S-box-containing protein
MTRQHTHDDLEKRIRELEQTEEELRIQKTYFETLFNSAPEAIVLHDNDDRIANVNEEFTKLFGFTRGEAVGKPINDLIVSEEYREEGKRISQRVIHGERIEIDTKRMRKDGTLVDVSILGAPIFHGKRQIGDYAIYRNITERRRSQEELLVQKTYLERLFNSAPEAIVLHDTRDIVISVNDEFLTMFGYTREEAVGRPVNELVASPEFHEEADRISARVIHGERVELDSRRQRKDGTLIDVWILGAPIFHGEQQIGVYAIYRDITERRKAEEARIRSSEEARMARNIQMNFLPKADPQIARYDIAARSLPAMNVGGDYYDFIVLDKDRIAIGLGDVSGNGLAASLVMANLQATIRSQALFDDDPATCLQRANTLLFRSTDARTFVTLFYGILDTRRNTLCYANAGQDLPVLFSAGRPPVQLRGHGMALGIRENVTFEKQEVTIDLGGRLLLYTDGIHEAMDSRQNEFGETRLWNIVEQHGDGPSRGLIEKIFSSVHHHLGEISLGDDMTAIVLRRAQ